MLVRDFSNYLVVSHIQGGKTPNCMHTLSERAKHVAYLISQCKTRQIRTVGPTAEAEDGWVETIASMASRQGGFFSGVYAW